jgi:hypothetical protein
MSLRERAAPPLGIIEPREITTKKLIPLTNRRKSDPGGHKKEKSNPWGDVRPEPAAAKNKRQ